jgi:hypothetical protein
MLAELRERHASGEIAAIYAEIRRLWAVPYVSSLQHGGRATVRPGLYRMLAAWPAFLAHVATELRPHLDDAATRAASQRLLAAVDAEIPAVFALLPSLSPTPPTPPAREFGDVLAALDAYRKTSPEMVVFGRMLGEALPA